MTIPGIGECSAMMLLAEIGEIGRFADPAALCNYAGLVARARKLLIAVYALLHDGVVFDEEKFATG